MKYASKPQTLHVFFRGARGEGAIYFSLRVCFEPFGCFAVPGIAFLCLLFSSKHSSSFPGGEGNSLDDMRGFAWSPLKNASDRIVLDRSPPLSNDPIIYPKQGKHWRPGKSRNSQTGKWVAGPCLYCTPRISENSFQCLQIYFSFLRKGASPVGSLYYD